jgi:hypothetical protein
MGSYEDERHWPQHIGAIRNHLRQTFNVEGLKNAVAGASNIYCILTVSYFLDYRQ